MKHVLLTDNDGGVLLVACDDQDVANEVDETAVWAEGGVSG